MKFKYNLPDSERVGWLIAETLRQMNNVGFTKLGRVITSIEAGIKMAIIIIAKNNSKSPTQYDTTP
mgnify:FL=1